MSGKGHFDHASVSGDMNPGVPSSLVTDANSGLSGEPRLQGSASINNESHERLPASPLSFTSNNVSGSSVIDGSTNMQQSPHRELAQKRGASSATSQLMEHDVNNAFNAMKNPRLGVRQEDIMQQHVIQQLQRRQELQTHQNLHMERMLQQHMPPQCQPPLPQRIVQLNSPLQRGPIAFQQQPLLRDPLQQQFTQPVTPVKRPFDYGICSRRLMQYLYHQRHRPSDNSILYWRKFVAEYFAPQAKERWCLSMYDDNGKHSLGVFSQSVVDAWQCNICGSKCGKGFEATFVVLPRLFYMKFDHGVIDENLFLGMPHESRLRTGLMILEYNEAVQETVYEHLRVVREGALRIIFTPELKIFRWDFCTRKHEEFLPRRAIAPQVNQLLQVAQKYRNAAGSESGSTEVSHQDLQTICNLFLEAGQQLLKNLELKSLNEFGFSKRYVRCLQISEVVTSMKDMFDFSQEHKIGPVESLKGYVRQATAKIKKQKIQEQEVMAPCQNLPSDQQTQSKASGFDPGMKNQPNGEASNAHGANQQSFAVNHQNLLNQRMLQQETSNSLGAVMQGQPLPYQGCASSQLNSFVNNISLQFQQQPQFNGCLPQPNNFHPSQINQHMQQHVKQQMLQDAVNNSRGASQPSPSTSTVTDMPVRIDAGQSKETLEMQSMPNSFLNNPMVNMPRTNSFWSSSRNPNADASNLNSQPDLADFDLQDFDNITPVLLESGMFENVDNGNGI